MMACRRLSVTMWRPTLRPARVPESPSAGGIPPSVVSYSNRLTVSTKPQDSSFILHIKKKQPFNFLQQYLVQQTATSLNAPPHAPPPVPTCSPSSATCLQPPVWRVASVMPATSSVMALVFPWKNVAVWTQTKNIMM